MNLLFFSFYGFSIFFLLNFFHPVFFWFFMELNLMFFILFSLSEALKIHSMEKFYGLFFYFLLQCLASFFFLFCCMFSDGLLVFSSYSTSFLISFLMLFKLGLFPFHFWIYNFCFTMSFLETFFVLTVQKIPFIVFILGSNWTFLLPLLIASSFAGVFFIWKSESVIFVLVSSSIYITFWFFISMGYSFFFFIFFFLVYSLFNFIGCYGKNYTFNELVSWDWIFIFFFVIFLLGLPPLSLFFFKFFSFFYMFKFYFFFFLAISWFLGFSSMMSYYKFFYNFFFIFVNEIKFFHLKNFFFYNFLFIFLFFFF